MTLDQVRAMLTRQAKKHQIYRNTSGVTAWCSANGVSKARASEFLRGKRLPTTDPRMARDAQEGTGALMENRRKHYFPANDCTVITGQSEALATRLLAKVAKNADTGCWDWTASKYPKGYGGFWDGSETRRAHRVSYQLFCGVIPRGVQVLHECDNPGCVNPQHLMLGSNTENVADKVSKGRQSRLPGRRNGSVKLTEADVLAIRAATGIKQKDLAKRYGVNQPHISRIRLGKNWSHLSDSGEAK